MYEMCQEGVAALLHQKDAVEFVCSDQGVQGTFLFPSWIHGWVDIIHDYSLKTLSL